MSNYAVGNKALGLCDRCGFQYKYQQLKKEWNGAKTCPDCFETKEPQLKPLPHAADAEALYEPRPDKHIEGGVLAVLIKNTGDDFASANTNFEDNTPKMVVALGTATVVIT
jgi:hypothetical protein|tara:strand:+ start:499 stop:831 length:333 start_codon:yes stop_codon:yes gene_type:complete